MNTKIGSFFPPPNHLDQACSTSSGSNASFCVLKPNEENQPDFSDPGRDYTQILNSISELWQSKNMTNSTRGSVEDFVGCLRDSTSRSWFLMPFYAYSCTQDVDSSLVNKASRFLEGTKDILQITIDFSILFFLWYMTRVPEKDAHYYYKTVVIAPASVLFPAKTLEEEWEKRPELLIQLSFYRIENFVDPIDHYVEITPKNDQPFYVSKDSYNMVAKEAGCQLK